MQKKRRADIAPPSVRDSRMTDEHQIIRRPAASPGRNLQTNGSTAPPREDRPLGFAQAVRKFVDGALYRCEERFPQNGPHSVLYVVVERDAAQWRERLNTLHRDYFGNGHSDYLMSVQLEVVDRSTHDALQRLVAAGVVAGTTRATRSLWPPDESTSAPPPLSEAEREKAGSYRCQAARKLKVAGVLAGGNLREEARMALLDAIEPLGAHWRWKIICPNRNPSKTRYCRQWGRRGKGRCLW